MMRRWFADGAFRTILLNSAFLLSGNAVSALLGLLALSCAGRGMSPEMFGVLVVIQAYTKAVSDLVKFQTWQFVVQFGVPALTRQDTQRVREVITFSVGLDMLSSAVAVAGGMLLLPFLSASLGLDASSFRLALLSCTLIPAMASSTPTGVLRACDRFDLIAIQQATKPLLLALGSVASLLTGAGFPGFVASWYFANVAGGLLFWWLAARELRRRRIDNALRPALFSVGRKIAGAWNFVWTTNLSHSIWAARNSCSTVLVGVVIGPVEAGLFKIAMTFIDAAGTPARLLEKSFYPELMRLDPASQRPWLLGLRAALLAGGIGLLFSLLMLTLGESLISLIFGDKYLETYGLIQIMLGAVVVSMIGFPQESLLLMAGRQRPWLAVQALASAGYIALLVVLSHVYRVQGSACAYLGGQCLEVLMMLILTLWAWQHRRTIHTDTPLEITK